MNDRRYEETSAGDLPRHLGKTVRMKRTLPDGSVKNLAGGVLVSVTEKLIRFKSTMYGRLYVCKCENTRFWVLC